MVAGPISRFGQQEGTRGRHSSRSVLQAIMRRWNLNALWLFCILQGFGGGMVPVAQSILFVPTGEARPSFCAVRHRRGGGPSGGLTLGGWLSSNGAF
jgi:hypothetical protein